MDFNKLTIKAQEAVAAAQELARRRGNPEITPEHLLLALLDQELFADWRGLRAEAEQKVAALPTVQGGQQQPNGRRPRSRACSTAPTTSGSSSRTTTSRPSTSSSRSSRCRATRSSRGSRRCAAASASPRRTRRGSYQALEKFGRDLTEAAEAGKLDPVIGRDEEIRRVIQIL